MKNLLITGGAGFIGTNLVRLILTQHPSWRVINLDFLTYAGNPANFADLPAEQAQRHELVQGDIRDSQLLDRLWAQHQFDAVLHLAAESHVDRSIVEPEAFVQTNLVGTFRLLEAVRRHWEQAGRPADFRFLQVSTDEVYGSLGPQGCFVETTPYDPSSPYAASKAGADHLARAYQRTHGLPVLVTNCSNNFGPYQFPEKLIPLMILKLKARETLPVYGQGDNVRDWLFVEDHCLGLLAALARGRPGRTYNLGGGAELTNLELVGRLCDLLDQRLGRPARSRELIRLVADRPGHDQRYAIDATRAHDELDWRPRSSFDQALARTVDWYLEHGPWVESVTSGEYRAWMQRNYGQRV